MIDFSNANINRSLKKISISSMLDTLFVSFDTFGVAKPTEAKKKAPSTIKEKLTQVRREYEDSLIAFETLAKKNKDDAFLNQVNQTRNADKIARSMISNRQVTVSSGRGTPVASMAQPPAR